MRFSNISNMRHHVALCGAVFGACAAAFVGVALAQSSMPNACPVDGCEVKIVKVVKTGNELTLTFQANFTPDVSKNHIHVWWGENYTVKQVSNNAETAYGVKQGDWHPTDDYPSYVTQSAASVTVRNGAHTLCVSAADRNHDILDPNVYQCVDVSSYL